MDLLGQLLGFAPGADTHGTDAPHDDEFRAGAAQEPPQESNPRRWALQNRAVYNLTNDVSSLSAKGDEIEAPAGSERGGNIWKR
jgi:hypothetical protein